MKPRVEVHIEELVLDGFEPRDRSRIGEAVRVGIAQRLAEGGLPGAWARGAAIERIDGGGFQMAGGQRAESVGREVASLVVRGMRRWP